VTWQELVKTTIDDQGQDASGNQIEKEETRVQGQNNSEKRPRGEEGLLGGNRKYKKPKKKKQL
jgi:hypothetical protein